MIEPLVPKKAKGRTLAEFLPLKPAEQKLLDAASVGEVAVIGNATPEKATSENSIRAEFFRFLMLGGDEYSPVDQSGIRIRGGYIVGELNLDGCVVRVSVEVIECNFTRVININDANVYTIGIHASRLHSIIAERSHFSGSLYLRRTDVFNGSVVLMRSHFDMDVDFQGSVFRCVNGGNEVALNCDGMSVGGLWFFLVASSLRA